MNDEQYRFITIVYKYTNLANHLYKYRKPIEAILQHQGKFYTDEQRAMLNNAGKDFIGTYPNMNPKQWKK